MANSKKDFTYYLLDSYLEKKPADFNPVDAVQLAHLAARAAVSGKTDQYAMYSKASIDALKKFATLKGYTLDVNAFDVLGMAVVSETRYPTSPEDRYLERLITAGRAKQLKAKAKKPIDKTPQANTIDDDELDEEDQKLLAIALKAMKAMKAAKK